MEEKDSDHISVSSVQVTLDDWIEVARYSFRKRFFRPRYMVMAVFAVSVLVWDAAADILGQKYSIPGAFFVWIVPFLYLPLVLTYFYFLPRRLRKSWRESGRDSSLTRISVGASAKSDSIHLSFDQNEIIIPWKLFNFFGETKDLFFFNYYPYEDRKYFYAEEFTLILPKRHLLRNQQTYLRRTLTEAGVARQ